jgi:hypothetical protein
MRVDQMLDAAALGDFLRRLLSHGWQAAINGEHAVIAAQHRDISSQPADPTEIPAECVRNDRRWRR